MQFGPGVAAVTLNGGRTYHQITSDEGRVVRVCFDVWSVWCPDTARHRQNGAWTELEPTHLLY